MITITVKEAKAFIIKLEHQICNETIDIFAKENEEICTKFFAVIRFALGNLVPNVEDSENKCKIDCPFFTSEHRELCKELCSWQNCYQCVIQDYEIMKQNYNLLTKCSNEYFDEMQNLKKENTELKVKIYELMNQENE